MKVKRHPIRGLFAGLLFGFGVACLLFVLGVLPVSVVTLAVCVVVGVAVGIGLAFVAPVRPSSPRP